MLHEPIEAKAARHLSMWVAPHGASDYHEQKYNFLLALTEDPLGDLSAVQAWAQAQLDDLS